MRRFLNNIKNHSNWFSFLIAKYFKGNMSEFTFQCRGGLKIKVPKRLIHTYKECFLDETYTKGLPLAIANKQYEVIVDIGANVGYFSLFMFSRNANSKIYAYEPIPKNFELLSHYKSDNTNFDFNIFNRAVTESNKEFVTLHYETLDSFTTSASIFGKNKSDFQLTVDATSLTSIFSDNQLDKIDFMKIDCEGSEYEILYTAPEDIFDKISVMAIETHRGPKENENINALTDFLQNKNFITHIKHDIIWAWK